MITRQQWDALPTDQKLGRLILAVFCLYVLAHNTFGI